MNSVCPTLLVLGLSLSNFAFAQTAGTPAQPDKPCGIGEITRDTTDKSKVLLTFPGRLHYQYVGPMNTENSTIAVGEGFVYRIVREADKISTINLGPQLSLKDGETIRLEQGISNCTLTPRLSGAEPMIEVSLYLEVLNQRSTRQYRLPVPAL